ncbi:hypothetical protein Kpho02_39920 [Kitasatospora phosalacinea]|uniref:Uncharacterized protein n=1 Tax=Kitasatospora phosalacinea TaxID=2065 RepID=A0A9W6QB48_9ACTN|nr:hypothetical protein [Kitasatospora phosalacinea]GLW71693.1 hypothetical protein Kpho02_39920 [Kitasatospora phosalacinea]
MVVGYPEVVAVVRWKSVVAGLVVVVAGAVGASGVAAAEGVQDERQREVCERLLDGLLPGLVPTSSVCAVNGVGQG